MEWSGGEVTVYLNVYDLVSNNWGHTLGFGLYHTGVEIMGQEYSFYGREQAAAGGGIIATVPRTVPPPAKYRESIEMGKVRMSHREIKAVISNLSKEFSGEHYHVMSKNCNSFSDALCVALLGKHIPGWINRAATCASPFAKWFGAPPASSPQPVVSTPKAFKGPGFRLSDSKASTATATSPSSVSPVNTNYTIKLDKDQPVTSLSLRLHDGSRRQAEFNHNHTVGDVRRFLDNITGQRSYDLITPYPKMTLKDPNQTLAEANLLNAVIIQQLK